MDLQARTVDHAALRSADRAHGRRHPVRAPRSHAAVQGQAFASGEERKRFHRDAPAPRARAATLAPRRARARSSVASMARRARESRSVTRLVIDERRLIELALRLVSTPSFTGSEEAAARLVRDELEALGLQTQWQQVEDGRANVLGTWAGAGGGPTLMFNGHL